MLPPGKGPYISDTISAHTGKQQNSREQNNPNYTVPIYTDFQNYGAGSMFEISNKEIVHI